MTETAVVAGIDEAGYGPTLGPLVLGATAFRVPVDWIGRPLWAEFSEGIAENKKDADGRIVVTDSKHLFSQSTGLKHLELACLAFLSVAGGPAPRSLSELIGQVSVVPWDEFIKSPWYAESDISLPREIPMGTLTRQGRDLKTSLSNVGAAFLGARINPVLPARYNASVARHDNKAKALWEATSVLMRRLWDTYPRTALYIDKQGARSSYGNLLFQVFGKQGATIRGFSEEPEQSVYRIEHGGRTLDLMFVQKGESRFLPIALASLYAKYVRELSMALFNRYWQHRIPGLKRTAGYPQDAVRFLEEIKSTVAKEGIAQEILIRSR